MTDSFAKRTTRLVLPNGLKLMILENHANPTVSLSGYLMGGMYFSPRGKYAAARLTADMLNKGTRQHGKLEIAERLESVGAGVSVSSNTFTASIGAQCISRDFPMIVSTLAEELREPTFPEEELEKLKQRSVASIKRAQDETDRRALERFSQIVYDEESPFHVYPAERRIHETEATEVADLKAFYDQCYGADSMVVAVVGDVNPTTVERLVTDAFGDWNGAPKPLLELEDTPRKETLLREQVFLNDKASVDVIMGHASGLRRANNDFLAAIVANRALGQSTLSSRLGLKVRDEMGLTYGINSYFSDSGLGDGPYIISVTVAPENADLAIDTTMDIVRDYVRNGITDEELVNEQTSMVGGYKLGLATNGGIAGQLASTEIYQLGVNYLDEYPTLIRSLTRSQVNDAVVRYIHPESMTTVLAGSFQKA